MASRLAQDVHLRLLAEGVIHYPQDEALRPIVTRNESAIDKELQEVREVLDGLSVALIDDGSGVETHWCNPEVEDCTDVCQRARVLIERLRVPEVQER